MTLADAAGPSASISATFAANYLTGGNSSVVLNGAINFPAVSPYPRPPADFDAPVLFPPYAHTGVNPLLWEVIIFGTTPVTPTQFYERGPGTTHVAGWVGTGCPISGGTSNLPVLLRGTAMPQMGNVGFSILCTNAPALSAGALFLSDRRLSSGVVVAGAELWVDPSAGLLLPLSSSDLQRAEIPLPIPAEPELIGGRVYAQAVWVGPPTPAPCPPLGFSTSFGLEISVQP